MENFEEMLDRVLGLVSYRIGKENITVEKKIGAESSAIFGDSLKIQQVLLNLVSNAIDSMETSDVKELRICLESSGGKTLIRVEDTGCGIPAEHLSRIYDPFFTSKSVGKGTGLGLSVSYGIVKDHKGDISCESEPGRGTRFTITLPENAPA
jgi:two-component system NtrC family sensor kinase